MPLNIVKSSMLRLVEMMAPIGPDDFWHLHVKAESDEAALSEKGREERNASGG